MDGLGGLTQAEAAMLLGQCERSFRRHVERYWSDGLAQHRVMLGTGARMIVDQTHLGPPIGASDPALLRWPTRRGGFQAAGSASRWDPLVNVRVQCKAAGQVVLKLKAAWCDGTTYLVMSALEFLHRQAALIPRPAALRRPIQGIECLERVAGGYSSP